jgi:deferrochelatase/peroxidase EfeB
VGPQQEHLVLAAFDVTTERVSELRDLLAAWSAAATRLLEGRRSEEEVAAGEVDTGEAHDLPPGELSLTFGLGPGVFAEDRFGLRDARPVALRPLPAFPGDALDPRRCDGELCAVACASDAQVAFHAFRTLWRVARGAARLRWAQTGFLEGPGRPRNLLGFKDGTYNVPTQRAYDRHVWIHGRDRSWMTGGTYLVARRIRLLLEAWDALPVETQERIIGRHKVTGAPLGEEREYDLRRLDDETIPRDAHVRVASPPSNDGVRLLRRSYNYFDGVDPDTGELDAGTIFLCYQRDPRRQYVPVQRRLAESDALSAHVVHTGSAIFAIPPAARLTGYIGEGMFEGVLDDLTGRRSG